MSADPNSSDYDPVLDPRFDEENPSDSIRAFRQQAANFFAGCPLASGESASGIASAQGNS